MVIGSFWSVKILKYETNLCYLNATAIILLNSQSFELECFNKKKKKN